MTELEKAARQALEALELHGQQYPHMVKGYCLDAITALRQALAEPEQPARQCWKCGDMDAAFQAKCNVPACGMKEQPAQQEPICRLFGTLPVYDRPPAREPAQQEQGDSACQEDDGCPTELAVLQRFWRGQPIPDEHYPAWFKPAQQEPVTLETVYETIIQWDEGGGKRSRRELARRIVALYTRPQAREPEQPAKEKAPQSANCEAPGWISSDHARGDDCTTEQPAQDEPVAWMHPDGRIWTFGRGFDKAAFTVPLYTRPQAREPLTEFNAAIDFAIEQGSEAGEFLRCWREGDTTEWPEFSNYLAAHGIGENT